MHSYIKKFKIIPHLICLLLILSCRSALLGGVVFKMKNYKKESKPNAFKHGEWGTPLYIRWIAMRDRCFNFNRQDYKHYGGRGITVCKKWNDYLTFKKWALENGFDKKLSLDRINVNKNYTPSNCRWVPHKIQIINVRKIVTNSSGYTGVFFKKDRGYYEAYLTSNGKRTYLGLRKTAKEASLLYEKARRKRNKQYYKLLT